MSRFVMDSLIGFSISRFYWKCFWGVHISFANESEIIQILIKTEHFTVRTFDMFVIEWPRYLSLTPTSVTASKTHHGKILNRKKPNWYSISESKFYEVNLFLCHEFNQMFHTAVHDDGKSKKKLSEFFFSSSDQMNTKKCLIESADLIDLNPKMENNA